MKKILILLTLLAPALLFSQRKPVSKVNKLIVQKPTVVTSADSLPVFIQGTKQLGIMAIADLPGGSGQPLSLILNGQDLTLEGYNTVTLPTTSTSISTEFTTTNTTFTFNTFDAGSTPNDQFRIAVNGSSAFGILGDHRINLSGDVLMQNNRTIDGIELSQMIGSSGTDLGTFTGSFLADNNNVKEAFQQIENFLASHSNSIALNTAKTGITSQQAIDIINNNAKRSFPLSEETKINDNATAITTKQDALVSGNSIKTINGQSLLGSGDISISSGLKFADEITSDAPLNLASIDSINVVSSATDVTLTLENNSYQNGDLLVVYKDSLTTGNIFIDGSAIGAPSIQLDTILPYSFLGYHFRKDNRVMLVGNFKTYTPTPADALNVFGGVFEARGSSIDVLAVNEGDNFNTWNDLSPNATNATAGVAPLLHLNGSERQARFTGSQYLEILNSANLNFTPGTDEFTIVVKLGDVAPTSAGTLIAKSPDDNNQSQWSLGIQDSNNMLILIGGQAFFTSNRPHQAHDVYIMTVTTTNVIVEADGVEILNTTFSGTNTNSSNVTIGARSDAGTAITSDFAKIKVFDRVLTTQEKANIVTQEAN